MVDVNIQDRDAFSSFQAIVEDLLNGGCKKDNLSRGYLLDDNDETTVAMNAFVGGKILDMEVVYSCVDHHANPTLVMVTHDTQRYNTK